MPGMDLLDRNGFDRLGSLRLTCERQKKTENDQRRELLVLQVDPQIHPQIFPENRQPVL